MRGVVFCFAPPIVDSSNGEPFSNVPRSKPDDSSLVAVSELAAIFAGPDASMLELARLFEVFEGVVLGSCVMPFDLFGSPVLALLELRPLAVNGLLTPFMLSGS